jgi:hypothetical protein
MRADDWKPINDEKIIGLGIPPEANLEVSPGIRV